MSEDFIGIDKRLYAEIPVRIHEFFEGLTEQEKQEILLISTGLFAKVYQAGCVFGLDFYLKETALKTKGKELL